LGLGLLQISMGAPMLVDVSEGFSSPIDIALKELESGILANNHKAHFAGWNLPRYSVKVASEGKLNPAGYRCSLFSF
jgi:hypothetical protein